VVTLQYKDKPLTIYRARLGSALKGVVFQVSERGYSGEILVLMAVDVDGKMLGARVLKHTETPGLGDKIEIAKDKWILSFNGKSLGEPPADKWGVKKDGGVFDQFAGATITPRAVVKAVKGGMLFFSEHKAEILGG
jgi:electron transport complex protein RnfG